MNLRHSIMLAVTWSSIRSLFDHPHYRVSQKLSSHVCVLWSGCLNRKLVLFYIRVVTCDVNLTTIVHLLLVSAVILMEFHSLKVQEKRIVLSSFEFSKHLYRKFLVPFSVLCWSRPITLDADRVYRRDDLRFDNYDLVLATIFCVTSCCGVALCIVVFGSDQRGAGVGGRRGAKRQTSDGKNFWLFHVILNNLAKWVVNSSTKLSPGYV